MLKLLDKNKVPLKGLRAYKDLCIERVLELDDRTLSFSVPYRNVRGYVYNVRSVLELEGYIETREDRYVVKEIRKSTDGMAKVVAQLDMESLEGKVFRVFKSEEQPIGKALQLVFAGTGWTVGVCSVTKKRTLSMSNVSALEVLKQALKTYRCEIKVHSKTQVIDVYGQIGEDRGAYFSSQLNLRKLDVQSTSYDFYTEIEPYGKDGLTIEGVNGGKNYLENHQYSQKRKRCIWKDERYTAAQSLKEDAEKKLADMSKPYHSYSTEVIDLARGSDGYGILEYAIGDTITILDAVTDTREMQRIVGMKVYPDEPERNTCTIANKVLTFDEMAQKYEDAANTVDNITNDNGQVDGDAIDGIHSSQIIDLEDGLIGSAAIKALQVKYLEVSGKVVAVEGEFGTLRANVAEFEKATVGRLEAAEADIHTLRTVDLESVNGKIDIFESNFSDIKSLLLGNGVAGDFQTIHITSQNAVLDSALVRTAVMQSVTIGDLMAGDISTNKFRILSDDGGILIQGATIQWRDTNGIVRMQAGKDKTGDFTFSLFDATGKGVLIDSAQGVHKGAIADGVIVDSMVADGAGISSSKLDIAGIFRDFNNSTEVIKSNRIWFDEEGQTLNQAYNEMSENMVFTQSTAKEASSTANAAADTAKKALDALEGISTLDALGASLDNDAHVVHTNTDGTGGDYTGCCTRITVYLGDTDVSRDSSFAVFPSGGVSGRWDGQSRTYYVTGLSSDDGYVDIEAVYGSGLRRLTTRSGKNLTTRGGKYLTIPSGGARIKKRFSISKAPDGRIGLSYSLRSNVDVLRKQKDKMMIPASVTFSSVKNDNGVVDTFAGLFRVEESLDDKTYALKYQSRSPERFKAYTPSSPEVKSIRCTLLSTDGAQELDMQSVMVLADAEGLAEDIQSAQDTADKAREAIVSTNIKVGQMESSVNGIKADLSEMNTDLHGLTDGTLLYNIRSHDNGDGNVTLAAVVYKKGEDVTKTYPARWYRWTRKTESGETPIGHGYEITVKKEDYQFGGVVAGEFVLCETAFLKTRSGNQLLTRSGKRLTIWREK